MPRAGFEVFLERRYPGKSTVKARFSNVARIERYYGSLEDHWRRDRFASILTSLSYSEGDKRRNAPNPSKIPIFGNVQNGLGTLRNALKLYMVYLDGAPAKERLPSTRKIIKYDPQEQLELSSSGNVAGIFAPAPFYNSPGGTEFLQRTVKVLDLSGFSIMEILSLSARLSEELRSRGVVRGGNLLGDYAEWLCITAFGWNMADASEKSFDATASDGRRIQIKARRLTTSNGSRQLSDIRNLNENRFDDLVGIIFNPDFTVLRGALIPRDVIAQRAAYVQHSNAWRFILADNVWSAPKVQDITNVLRAIQVA